MLPIHQRMAEIWMINKKRPLEEKEMLEMNQCLEANTKLCWEMACLENLSLMASMTNDIDWQHEICREIDEIGKTKKPGPRKRNTDK